MKKLAFLGVAAGVGIGVLLIGHSTRAADHLDAPSAVANPMADITDVYAWMTPDAAKVNLVMDVSPADDGTHHFDPTVQYVFHVTSHPGAQVSTAFGAPGTETKVICTFASDTSVQCWVVGSDGKATDYVKGDPSNTAGLDSADGKLKVFAGQRSDPFFFNFQGFEDALKDIASNATLINGARDAAGCPNMSGALAPTAGKIASDLSEGAQGANAMAPCPGDNADCFIHFNVKSIVVQVDKSLLLDGSDFLVSVWGSTHAAM